MTPADWTDRLSAAGRDGTIYGRRPDRDTGAGFGTTLLGIAGRAMLRQWPVDDVRLWQFHPRLDRHFVAPTLFRDHDQKGP